MRPVAKRIIATRTRPRKISNLEEKDPLNLLPLLFASASRQRLAHYYSRLHSPLYLRPRRELINRGDLLYIYSSIHAFPYRMHRTWPPRISRLAAGAAVQREKTDPKGYIRT